MTLVCVVFVFAAFVQASLGFGFALVAMSILALSQEIVHAASVVNIAGSVLAISMSLQLRRSIAWDCVRRVLPAAVVGVVVGVWLLGNMDRRLAVHGLGTSILLISLWNLRPHATRARESVLWDLSAGFGSGVLCGAFNQGGPPLVAHLYRYPFPAETLKGTVQLIFLVTGLLRLSLAAAHGQLGPDVWREALLSTPFAAMGLVLGLRASAHLDDERFRRLSWVALSFLGTYLTFGT